MSTSPEQEASASSTTDTAASQNNPANNTSGEVKEKGAEKTISCVSCRRRKLKCDRVKPKCGTCSRLRHECEYPERRRNIGTKRRNMKELEARLAQVETQLVAETQQLAANNANNAIEMNVNINANASGTGSVNAHTNANANPGPEWSATNMDMELNFTNEGMQNIGYDILSGNVGTGSSVPAGDYFSQDVISLGLQEPLPPDNLMDELYQLYFERFHPTLPMIHKGRFYAALNMPTNYRPPIALRYAMMMVAASISDNYQSYAEIFYERTRRYAEITEMKGQGQALMCIQLVQAWALISNYEATNAYFSRAWMSTGRCARLCHMLSLQRLDAEGPFGGKKLLPTSKDWIELEERRRTFWASYYGDRWSSCATGWPMMFDEDKIDTNLPCSNDAFDSGVEENTCSLAAALTPEGASTISAFAGVILSACLFGRNAHHIQKSGPDDGANDFANGEFWKTHRKMDNILSNTFMFLPDHLRLPAGLRDPNIVFFHMNIHCATICLHQGAALTAERENISQSIISQSEARSLMAAEEITNLMRLISHLDASKMTSWIGFCLYVASGVILQDTKKDRPNPQSSSNLEFMLSAMKAVGKKHIIARHFTTQLELEMKTQRVDRNNMANSIYDLHNSPDVDDPGLCVFPIPTDGKFQNSIDTGQTGAMSINTPPQATQQTPFDVISKIAPAWPSTANFPPKLNQQGDSGSETMDTDFSWPQTGNTPSSESSTSNTTYPYRNSKSTDSNANWVFDPEMIRFTIDPLVLNVPRRDMENEVQDNVLLNDLLNGAPWDSNYQNAGQDPRHSSG
ncbi:binuclear zinc transcription factor [Botrytis cinerea]